MLRGAGGDGWACLRGVTGGLGASWCDGVLVIGVCGAVVVTVVGVVAGLLPVHSVCTHIVLCKLREGHGVHSALYGGGDGG